MCRQEKITTKENNRIEKLIFYSSGLCFLCTLILYIYVYFFNNSNTFYIDIDKD
jgi:hypothetical protein